ncbi:MAG: hypothetical protein AAF664_00955 [Planctomycetota bacterium]
MDADRLRRSNIIFVELSTGCHFDAVHRWLIGNAASVATRNGLLDFRHRPFELGDEIWIAWNDRSIDASQIERELERSFDGQLEVQRRLVLGPNISNVPRSLASHFDRIEFEWELPHVASERATLENARVIELMMPRFGDADAWRGYCQTLEREPIVIWNPKACPELTAGMQCDVQFEHLAIWLDVQESSLERFQARRPSLGHLRLTHGASPRPDLASISAENRLRFPARTVRIEGLRAAA